MAERYEVTEALVLASAVGLGEWVRGGFRGSFFFFFWGGGEGGTLFLFCKGLFLEDVLFLT